MREAKSVANLVNHDPVMLSEPALDIDEALFVPLLIGWPAARRGKDVWLKLLFSHENQPDVRVLVRASSVVNPGDFIPEMDGVSQGGRLA